jgi:succinoglycan biosynthesis transport protein ExoP
MADYLAILWRRKWIILALPILAAVTAFTLSKREAPVYQANAEVLVNRSAGTVTAVTGVLDPAASDSTRFLATTAKVARSPELAARAVAAAGVPGVTAGALLGMSDATAQKDADLLDLSVTYANPADAVLLVNAYATEFTHYKTELDTARVNDALKALKAKTAYLQAHGANPLTYQKLIEDQGELETVGRLLSDNTSVLQPAAGASQISPRPRRDLIVGGLLGLFVALGLAFLVEALDRRVRTGEEIMKALGLPLLGRLARPPRRLRMRNDLVMLREPVSVDGEAFRKLRASIELMNRERGARTIMFTSAEQREGKSTTIANLAISFARAGRRVALVDLDVRRPFLHTLFHVRADRGFADVFEKRKDLIEAMQQIPVPVAGLAAVQPGNGRPTGPTAASNGRSTSGSVLHLLPCGTIPSPDAEFLAADRVSAALEELGEAFDIVLIDAPPLLAVGDAMSLSAKVDALVVVTHSGIQRSILDELARELQNCDAPRLGFVLTGVPHREGYGYGYGHSYGYGAPSPLQARAGRGRQRV